MRRNSKKLVCLIMLVLAAVIFIPSITTEAAKSKLTNSCAKAYAKKLNQIKKKWYKSTFPGVIVKDVNADGTPELIINPLPYSSSPAKWTVYTYKKRKIIEIGTYSGYLYNIKGKSNQFKFKAMYGVGTGGIGTVTFGKKSVISKQKLAYSGMPIKYYINNKKSSYKKYQKSFKNYTKTMSDKNQVRITDLYKYKWSTSKIKLILQ